MNEHVAQPFQGILNQFAQLSAENPEHRQAQLTLEEEAEYNAYLDAQQAEWDRQFTEWHGDSDGTVGVD